ncbi:MAG: FAD-binding protein, partial [Thermodesulfobacteriota bacterium]
MTGRLCDRFNRRIEADVLVIGGGIAGLLAAIRAREFTDRVVLVDKAKVGRSGCSPFAAGIYSIFFPDDDLSVWLKEMAINGDFLNDQEWSKLLCLTSHRVASLIDGWAKHARRSVFDKDSSGQLIRKKSRGHIHTHHCVINALALMDTLVQAARDKGVEFIERVMVTDLLMAVDGRAGGALGFNYLTGDLYSFSARAVILAAGGCGFKSIFLGHKNLTGDMQAAAYRIGAEFKNMEQSGSNTCYKDFDIHGMNLFVNVGGKFINSQGREFMWDYHPVLGSKARLPDLVMAFCREVKEGRGPIYLDLSAASCEGQKLCRRVLPESFKAWDRAGINPFLQPVEWVPSFYGTIATSGGLNIDLEGRTNLKGLFAAGDATYMCSNGSTGLGGTALGFGAASGYVVGERAGKFATQVPPSGEPREEHGQERVLGPLLKARGPHPDELILKLQRLLIRVPVVYLKTPEELKRSLADLENLDALAEEAKAEDLHQLVKCHEVKNMIGVARLFLQASLFREESRGFHFREDFPLTDNKNWLKWVCQREVGSELSTWGEDIPLPYVR